MIAVIGGVLATFFLLTAPQTFAADADTNKKSVKPIWLVVTRPIFTADKTLDPLVKHRQLDGFQTIVSTEPIAKAIAACPRKPSFILLVGDAAPDSKDAPWYIPTKQKKFYRWIANQKKTYASDMAWGDLDGDNVPDIPVGRLPVRTTQQLKNVVAKIMEYETCKPTLTTTVIPIWAGNAEFGAGFDRMAAQLLLSTIRQYAPHYLQPWILYGSPNSPFVGAPQNQPAIFNMLLRDTTGIGCMIGHGNETGFFSMMSDGKVIAYTTAHAEAGLGQTGTEKRVGPVVIILTCLSGKFTHDENSLAESMLLAPSGPPAVIAATTQSHPLPNMTTGQAMLDSFKPAHTPLRLGTFWLKVVTNAPKYNNLFIQKMLKDVEGSLESEINVKKLFQDQKFIYAILGDPAMKLPLPKPLDVKIQRTADGWAWTAEKPKDAYKLCVGLRYMSQKLPAPPKPTDTPKVANKIFQTANDTFIFRKLETLDDKVQWSGIVKIGSKKNGRLRFVAIGEKDLYVATFDLKTPKISPTTAATTRPAKTKPATAPVR
ncbi:MAG: hypothetical protein KAR11_01440 [Phycisphaerae bacterium]|nr:hypothetical protein [Phycisphaerae bacterium]